MKALPKKRKHQMTQILLVILSKASLLLKYQALWYSACIAVYIWFLYWVAYDFFVWQKPISEINAVNYAGAIAAIAFIWAGTKILKRDQIKASPQQTLLPQQPKPQQPPQKTAPATAPANSTCTHYLGYLNKRQNQQEIPAECLTCEHVIKCMSSTN